MGPISTLLNKLFETPKEYCLKCGTEVKRHRQHCYCPNTNCERYALVTLFVRLKKVE